MKLCYFNSFGVEHVLEEIKKIIGDKKIKANVDWFYNFSSSHDFKKNDIILSYFKDG